MMGLPVKSLQISVDENNFFKPLTKGKLLIPRGGNGSHHFHPEHGCQESLSGEPSLAAE